MATRYDDAKQEIREHALRLLDEQDVLQHIKHVVDDILRVREVRNVLLDAIVSLYTEAA